MAFQPPPNASSSQLTEWLRRNGISSQDGLKYLNDLLSYNQKSLRDSQLLLNCANYLLFLNDTEQPRPTCVVSNMSCVPDGKFGSMLPCCGGVICRGAQASFGPGTICPVEGCDQVMNTDIAVDDRVIIDYAELLAAYRLLKSNGEDLAAMQGMAGDQKISDSMPLNALIENKAPKEEVMGLARKVALAHRDVMKDAAIGILRNDATKMQTRERPKPNITSGPALSASPVPSPAKRPRATAANANAAPCDDPIDIGEELPPAPSGRRYPCRHSPKYSKNDFDELTIMKTRFSGKCPVCKAQLTAERSLVSPINKGPDTKALWICSVCAFGLTSKELLAALRGEDNGARPAKAQRTAKAPVGDDVANMFTI